MLAIYRVKGHWGAVAKSNYAGCRYREPVYRSLRELAMSYFDIYFNLRRERTLRTFSRPVNLARFDDQAWMTTEEPIWFIIYHLLEIHHYKLLTPDMVKRLHRIDEQIVSRLRPWERRTRKGRRRCRLDRAPRLFNCKISIRWSGGRARLQSVPRACIEKRASALVLRG